MRRLIGFIGLLSVAAMAAPAVAAYLEKTRREEDGIPVFDETADEIDVAAIFDNVEATSRATSFRGGEVVAWYGGGSLDLREATLDPAGAELRVRAMFGGLEIVVPSSWPIELHSRAILGGVGDARDAEDVDPTSPTLVIDAQTIFGGLAIVASPDDFGPVIAAAPAG